jgi:hypothetical protein
MADQELLERITVRPEVFGGKPIIRDMRISVELILSLLTHGETPHAILGETTQTSSLMTFVHALHTRTQRSICRTRGGGGEGKFLLDPCACAGRHLAALGPKEGRSHDRNRIAQPYSS